MVHISKSEKCYNAQSALYNFYMKMNLLQDFHICVGAPLSEVYTHIIFPMFA